MEICPAEMDDLNELLSLCAKEGELVCPVASQSLECLAPLSRLKASRSILSPMYHHLLILMKFPCAWNLMTSFDGAFIYFLREATALYRGCTNQ
mmetsp:Transcript_2626/g.6985  ORF Transcript_2626/g.6985 Transcript_2626/m.6985 type:complete len:94 (-) Transcript_2626:27-308(-)